MVSARTVRADSKLRGESDWNIKKSVECFGEASTGADSYVAAYLTVLDQERRMGSSCQRRRFFVATRFDVPMALQPPPYANVVYDARPRTIVDRVFRDHGPGTGPCDYVIASQAELDTERGNILINALKREGSISQIGASGPYVIFKSLRH